MSNKRHNHGTNVKFKGDTPKTRIELDNKGIPRKVAHVIGNATYNPTKGFRKISKYHEHGLLNALLQRLNLYAN